MKQHPRNWECISRQPRCSKGGLKDRAQAAALSLCVNWATGAKTGGSRQGFRQEAALGECGLIPLLSLSLNHHRLEGILKEAKKKTLHCFIPMASDFQRNLSIQKDFLLSTSHAFSAVSFSCAIFSSP